jgi:heat shock protein HslJ
MKTTFYSLLIFLFLTTCDNNTGIGDLDNLQGTWKLDGIIYQDDIAISIPADVTIDFNNDATFNGKSTCNNYGGEISMFTKEAISFSTLFTTEIACSEPELNAFENNYYLWLSEVKQYHIENNRLALFFSNTYLYFEKE